MNHSYVDISHFRAPYKNSVISGFGSCQGLGCAGYGAVGFGVLEVSQQVQGLKAVLAQQCQMTGPASNECRKQQFYDLQSPFSQAVLVMLRQRIEAGHPTDQLIDAIAKEVMYLPNYMGEATARAQLSQLLNKATAEATASMRKKLLFHNAAVAPVATSPDRGDLKVQGPYTEGSLYFEEPVTGTGDDKPNYLLWIGVGIVAVAAVGAAWYLTPGSSPSPVRP